MTLDTTAASALRGALAAHLTESGTLTDPAWRRAVETVPRHVFVPEFLRQQPSGVWEAVAEGRPGYLEEVYADVSLTTQVTDGRATSSSSQPDLMLTMLEALSVDEGMTVLEIATGSGYNAALLSERLGSENVTSVEIDPDLVALARRRLTACGYSPLVLVGDGRRGHVEGGQRDRLIATVGMDGIPAAWLSQVKPGGIIVSPLGWGNVRLVVGDNGRAEGRFLPGGSFFMAVREAGGNGGVPYPGKPDALAHRPAIVDPSVPFTEDAFKFALSLMLPSVGMASETEGGVNVAAQLWAADGSWARVEDGQALQGGPRRLWDVVERAWTRYKGNGRPVRERYGVSVTEDGHRVWIDQPSKPLAE
ncbi:methyltransferase domain-containing protein [Streptacidiphilus albus]|uniref:methyltransferase domain-containing protein n=1 Tax=Streptacidiphilus albus TaxID=105425 RepID=UPI00054BC9EA|nr:methyltransferase domain-containing protein [Streptacidiphilus albus]